MLNFFKRFSPFKTKATQVTLSQLNRILQGQGWSDTKFLETYGKSLYVYACVSKIAEKTASVDFELYQILNSRGETKEIQVHPAINLLYKPNAHQTKAEFLENLIINLKLTGNGYVWKLRNTRGQVVELWNLRPDRITMKYGADGLVEQYVLTREDGTQITFAASDVAHFSYPSPLHSFLGMGPLKPVSAIVDTEEAMTEYQKNFFANNARPDAILKIKDMILNADQTTEIQDDWDKKYKGAGKTGKLAVLEGNVDYQQISISQREMDYIESKRFTRDDVLVAFKVPKPIIAITDDVNRANAREAVAVFLSETIKPEVKRLVERINEEIIIPEFGETLYLTFTDPTPQDIDMKLKEYESGLTHNWLLINEVRAMENLPPVSGGWDYYLPVINVPAGGLDQNGQPTKSLVRSEAMSKSMRAKLERTVLARMEAREQAKRMDIFKGRFILHAALQMKEELASKVAEYAARVEKKRKEKKNVKKDAQPMLTTKEAKAQYYDYVNKKIDKSSQALKPAILTVSQEQRNRVIDNLKQVLKPAAKSKKKALTIEQIKQIFDTEAEDATLTAFIMPYIEQYLKAAGQDTLDIIKPGQTFNFSAAALEALKKRAKFFAETTNATSLEKLTATLSQGIDAGEGISDLTDRVQSVYKEFDDFRAERIARTETTAANNEGFLQAYKQSDVATHKQWIATLDDRTRDSHLAVNDEIVPVDDNFTNGLRFPGDESADPGETINCRCVMAPAFSK